METANLQSATDAIKNWQTSLGTDLPGLFLQNSNMPTVDGISGNTNYPDQYSKLLGIDFGSVGQGDFLDFLKNLDPGDPNNSLAIVLAATNTASEGGVFNLYFETTRFDESSGETNVNYYESSGVPFGGRVYDILPAPLRYTNARFGVSSELRNQFLYNWQVAPDSILGDLFYGRVLPKPVTKNVLNGALAGLAFPRYEALVRVHRYIVSGKNLETLKVAVNQNSNLSVRFGVNTSDLLISRDLFTLIIEIKQRRNLIGNIQVNQQPGNPRGTSGSNVSLTVQAKINFEITNSESVLLNVTLTDRGVKVEFDGQNDQAFHAFNQQIPISFDSIGYSNERGVIWVTPRYVYLRIDRFGEDSKVNSSMLAPLKIDFEGPETAIQALPTYSDETYLEFVGACPPFCPPPPPPNGEG